MKRLIFGFFLLASPFAFAQYTPIPSSSYPALDAILNAKLTFTTGSGVPGGTCTYGRDVYTDTVTGNMYWCTATNTWTLMINVSGAQTLTNKTVDGISPTIFGYLSTLTSDVQTQLNGKQASGSYEVTANKGAASGYAPLDSGTKIPATYIPVPAPSTLGGTKSIDCSGTGHILKIDTTGTPICSADSGTGGGSLVMTTGAGVPSASCVAPSSSNLAVYSDSTNNDIWFCYATNSWKKVLSVTGSGQYLVTGATGTAPSNPSSGNVSCYFDSTTNTQICLDSAGNAFTMVKGATSTAHQFLTNVGADGIQVKAQPAFSDLSGSITPSQLPVRRIAAYVFDGGGSALSGTLDGCVDVPIASTITGVTLLSDVSGSATVDVRTVAYSSYTGPSSASSIAASAIPALSSATKYQDTTLTGWTTAIAANTVLCFHLTSPATATWVMADVKGN